MGATKRAACIGTLAVVVLTGLLTFAAPGTAGAGGSSWVQVSAGASHTCAIRADGRLFCWGDDSLHQLGDGGTNAGQSVPTEVAGDRVDWVQVSAGQDHTCARTADQQLYCWGSDNAGELGDGSPDADQQEPVLVAGGIVDWTDVSAGAHRTCGVRATGQLLCWGSDAFGGPLGNGGANVDEDTPVPVAGGATNWADVEAGGDYHVCAIKTTGRLFCWGYDRYGQLGDGGTNVSRHTPQVINRDATNWAEVSLGARHTCGRKQSGRLFCWGSNALGQLGTGDGRLVERQRPVLVAGSATWTTVAAGGEGTCAVRTSGRAYCWGDDRYGQVGDGTARVSRSTPSRVSSDALDWAALDVGGGHACGRQATARLFCWGNDATGAVGDGGTDTDQPEPVEVA